LLRHLRIEAAISLLVDHKLNMLAQRSLASRAARIALQPTSLPRIVREKYAAVARNVRVEASKVRTHCMISQPVAAINAAFCAINDMFE
jgi:hypothetical protein